MALEADLGELFVGGFSGPEIPPDFAALARDGQLGGAVLFRRNLPDLETARALTDALHALRTDAPLLVSVDQEGGRVQRLRRPFPELPPMRRLGETADPALCREAGRTVGLGLRALGFDQDYAPVLDVDSNPANPVIGDRAFSADPERVGTLGVAFGAGLEAAGVASCGKHFPGHGDTALDSHLALPRLPHPMARLEAVELIPFRRAVEAGLASLMTAHVIFDAVDPERPATLSPAALALLRGRLGYEGVVVSDDLEMRAIADGWGIAEAAVAAIAAGCDQVLICEHPALVAEAFDAARAAVRSGDLPAARIAEAAARVRRLKARFVRPEAAAGPIDEVLPRAARDRLSRRLGALGPGPSDQGPDPTERT